VFDVELDIVFGIISDVELDVELDTVFGIVTDVELDIGFGIMPDVEVEVELDVVLLELSAYETEKAYCGKIKIAESKSGTRNFAFMLPHNSDLLNKEL
jgi:hypothetical protein